MICSSTPFITGRPFTMFFNDKVYSEGAVGVAVSGVPHSLHVDFPPNLKPVTPEVTITRCVPRACTTQALVLTSSFSQLRRKLDKLPREFEPCSDTARSYQGGWHQ